MASADYRILLADDDEDDCMFFKDALDELSIPARIHTIRNGAELMNFLENHTHGLPDVIFLDLNMPRKSGYDCLAAMKANEKLRQVPVIIYSTSSNQDMIDRLYAKGAQYYVRKPADFKNLKSVIQKALSLSRQTGSQQPQKDNFVVQP